NWLSAFAVTILAVIAGCASEKKMESMDTTLRLYERSIKWGSYADAQSLSAKPEPQERLDRYKEIKVISYEVLRQEIVGDFEQINQIVDIKFYHEQQGKIETVRDTQVWIYDKDREIWVLQTGLPDFMSVLQ
ncbi:MAG: hypothetical protein L0Y43_00170, partial [Methylococcaceae bacterium]|nr:hypothetical protein [Methylococcaceae bacterium]